MSLLDVAVALLHGGGCSGLGLLVKVHWANLMNSVGVLADPRELELELGVAVGGVFVDTVDDLGALVEKIASAQRAEVELLDLGLRCLLGFASRATKVSERHARRLDAVHLGAVLFGPSGENHTNSVRADGRVESVGMKKIRQPFVEDLEGNRGSVLAAIALSLLQCIADDCATVSDETANHLKQEFDLSSLTSEQKTFCLPIRLNSRL